MKQYVIDNEKLLNEWDSEMNTTLSPENTTIHSNKKVWWMCKNGHKWVAMVNDRSRGNGCPYCSGRKVLKGFNDLETVNTKLAQEWNYEKNYPLTPSEVSKCSGKKVWWICKNGHEWEESITNRKKGNGCPYCSHHKLSTGETDLKTINPQLSKDFNYKKNYPLIPDKIFAYSNQKIWWTCNKGHEWEETPANRSAGKGCPYCSGNRVLIGYNDLSTTNPILASEWNYDKNKSINPNNVSEHSNKIVWWICKYGHEWESSINNRSNGNKCPICSSGNQTSFPEQAMFYYLNKVINVKNREKVFGKEIDIWMPDLNIGIEYNGSYYHKNEEKDNNKILFFKNYGIKIITIRDGLENKVDKDVIVHKYNDIEYAIRAIFSVLNLDCPKIDIKNDRIKIYEKSSYYKNEKSLELVNPPLAKEWNYDRNGLLKPNMVAPNSSKKVWWICSKCKNEWESVIFSRNRGCGCPKCKIQKIKESSSKKIAQYDLEHNFIKEWSSMTSASNELGISLSLISNCCNGKIKTCGGFCWEYI